LARISGINLPTNKRVETALTYIYGIGLTTSKKICKNVGISDSKRVSSLTDEEVLKIREYIENKYKVEGDLRSQVSLNIKRLTDLGTYRGLRHRKKLPVRGQRTHTNARTRKGKGVAIANKKKVTA
tara:strand:- start:1603 stop:1980 length:378 start_codon:yes stop_codon:yes gene_type:complete